MEYLLGRPSKLEYFLHQPSVHAQTSGDVLGSATRTFRLRSAQASTFSEKESKNIWMHQVVMHQGNEKS
jgi:hypothetical protein